jgi:diguanylate cyclase (GGDEF)-like protein/PAS domain S-box-containing protein
MAKHALDALLTVPLVVVLHLVGLAGQAPLWVLIGLLVVGGASAQPAAQGWLNRTEAGRRLAVMWGLQYTVTGLMIYLIGWGPLLAVGFVVVAALHVRTVGAAAWRPALAWTGGVVGAGQAAIALGWVFCYLPSALAQVAGILGGMGALAFIRTLGQAVEQRERAEAEVLNGQEHFRALVQDSSDVVSVVDRDWRVLYISPAVRQVTGFRPADHLDGDFRRWIHHEDLPAADRLLAQALADPGGQHRTELRSRHADGSFRWLEVTLRNLLDNPAVAGVVATYRDVTERRAVQERLAYDANHDPLTGLANRAAFLRALDQAFLDGRRRSAGIPAVLFLDLDGFKDVNDTFGHQRGDALIVAVAAMLRRSVLGSDIVGRLGGDEFGVVLTGIDSPDKAVAVTKRLLAEMNKPVMIGGQTIHARASIGVALAEPRDADASVLLHHADVAMYAAKRRQTHGFQLYVAGMEAHGDEGVSLEQDLRRAVDEDQLRLLYQPIVALDGGGLVGVEALVRWEHPTRGLLGPLEFVPLAEQSGVINELGAWVLQQACRQVRQWQREVPAGRRLRLSVNVSPLQLERADLVDEVVSTLRQTGFDPGDLVLEVTETAMVTDDAALPQLTALNRHGIRIALDDFGTGYSSLRYLTRLPVDILKIDRCFVAELDGTGSASAVAGAVIRLAQILHMETVAEGIETAAQATELTLMGCQNGQGYHIARPLSAETVSALIAGSAPRWPVLAGTTEQLRTGHEGPTRSAVG